MIGLQTLVTKSNYKKLYQRYYLKNKKVIRINNMNEAKSLIGTEIELRSPNRCKLDKNSYCGICCGDIYSRYENGIP